MDKRFQHYGETVCQFVNHATRKEKAAIQVDVMDGEIFESERGTRYFWFWQDAPMEETDGMVTVSKDLSHYTQVLLLDENGLVLHSVEVTYEFW